MNSVVRSMAIVVCPLPQPDSQESGCVRCSSLVVRFLLTVRIQVVSLRLRVLDCYPAWLWIRRVWRAVLGGIHRGAVWRQ